MSAIITFAYPRTPRFDMAYYTSKHMPLVASTWQSRGMRSWIALDMGPDSPYAVQCLVRFTSLAAFDEALRLDSAEVMADIKNYSDVEPVIIKGNVTAEWER